MKDFLLVYRNDFSVVSNVSEEERKAMTKKWMDWLGSVAAQDRLVDKGHRLQPQGKVVRPKNMVTDGPYIEIKESIGGYSLVRAESLDDAITLAKGCPVLGFGGNVEVREVMVLG